MKKKHRRAVWISIILIPATIGFIGYYISEVVVDFNKWLKTKLRVYDCDPD